MSSENLDKLTDEEFLEKEAPSGDDASLFDQGVDDDTVEGSLDDLDSSNSGGSEGVEGEAESFTSSSETETRTEPSEPVETGGSEASAEEAGESETGSESEPSGDGHTAPNHSNTDSENPEGAESTEGDSEDADKTKASGEGEDAEGGNSAEPVDYEAEYKRLMSPFKANGKEVKPESPDEAIRLMQMGANYTKKMQALKPHLKMVRMLENNGLLDEGQISHAIDLMNGNPQAIQKLLHEKKVDPLDLDTSSEPEYRPADHSVSDQEFAFKDALTELGETEEGKRTIRTIQGEWDAESKSAIYQSPELLKIIQTQRENGIYEAITNEMDRQKTLGSLNSNTPFLEAYKQVGDHLNDAGKLPSVGGSSEAGKTPAPRSSGAAGTQGQARQPVETRTHQRSAPAANGDAARAASPARTATPAAKNSLDPLKMTDDEIMAIETP